MNTDGAPMNTDAPELDAPAVQLREPGLAVVQQYPVSATYWGQVIGDHFADLLEEEAILMLINFGMPRVAFRRVVLNL